MNQRAIKVLEFDKIIHRLAEKASSDTGRKKMPGASSSGRSDSYTANAETQTRDALGRLFQKGSVSFGNAKDIRGSLMRLHVGSTLGIGELLRICGLLENTARVKAYSRSDREDRLPDSLDPMFSALEPLTPLSTEIRRCILSEEEISDDASPGLRQIRRSMKLAGERIHTQLASPDQRQYPELPAGCSDHHAGRPVLHPGKGRI